jgi:RecA-family ATPase
MLNIKKASELQVVSSNDAWLIENVIPRASLCLLGAAPKQGKTMIALELSVALCSGLKAFDKHQASRKGRVLYFAGEDSETGLKARIDGFCKNKGVNASDLELYAITGQTLLVDNKEGQQALASIIEQMKPDMVVLDNLSRIHRSNENNATAMGELFEFLQSVKLKFKCSILLVAHMGKDGTLRGSSQIDSYYEAAMFLKSDKSGKKYADFKFRNYEERTGVPYSLKTDNGLTVCMGEDENEQASTEWDSIIDGNFEYFYKKSDGTIVGYRTIA